MSSGAITTIIVGVLAATGGGVLAALVTGYFTRPKTKAEAEAIATDAALKVVTSLQNEVKRLSDRLEEAESDNAEARTRAEAAEARATAAEYNVIKLNRGMRACNDRIAYLTRLLEQNGIVATPWTPPEGLDTR